MYGSRLTRDFGDSCPDTWKRAINQLTTHEIQRGLARLLRTGASAPTLPAFVKACRMIGEEEGPSAPTGQLALPDPNYDPFHAFGQRALLAWLLTHGGASEVSLHAMIKAKNSIVDLYREIGQHDTVDPQELKQQLFQAFSKAFVPMDFEEQETQRAAYCGIHSLQFTPNEPVVT